MSRRFIVFPKYKTDVKSTAKKNKTLCPIEVFALKNDCHHPSRELIVIISLILLRMICLRGKSDPDGNVPSSSALAGVLSEKRGDWPRALKFCMYYYNYYCNYYYYCVCVCERERERLLYPREQRTSGDCSLLFPQTSQGKGLHVLRPREAVVFLSRLLCFLRYTRNKRA